MRKLLGLFFFAVLFLIVFFGQAISLYTDWLWFQEVGYTQIFTTTLTFKVALALVFGALFALLLYFSIKLAAHAPRNIRFLEQENAIELPSPELIDPLIQRLLLPGAILLGLLAAPQAAGHWQSLLLFFNSVTFGVADPLFKKSYPTGHRNSCSLLN